MSHLGTTSCFGATWCSWRVVGGGWWVAGEEANTGSSSPATRRRHRLALTLIELLVVLGILGVLLGLLLVGVQRARETANLAICQNNLRQMGLALQSYHQREGCFPPGYQCKVQTDLNVTSPGWGWASFLLDDLEEVNLANQINPTRPVEDPANLAVRTRVLKHFVCPSDRETGVFTIYDTNNEPLAEAATNSYAACFGIVLFVTGELDMGDGIFFRNSEVRIADITDGTSNTIALGERASLFVQSPWLGAVSKGTSRITDSAPTGNLAVGAYAACQVLAQIGVHQLNSSYSAADDFFSPHSGFVYFLFADGSVHALSSNTPLKVLQALVTRAQGEKVNLAGWI